MTKYIAQWVRNNPGKKDYTQTYKHTNNTPVLFENQEDALAKAKSICSQAMYSCHSPSAVLFDEVV
jgi:hypothetical protein